MLEQLLGPFLDFGIVPFLPLAEEMFFFFFCGRERERERGGGGDGRGV